MTYRERREAKAERLREYAEKREHAAAAVHQSHERFRGDHAFNFQPGHIPLRAQVNAQADRAFDSERKASSMASRADEIDRQAAGAIYSDDPDAVEKLTAKIAGLEAQREKIKAANAAYRKEHRAELKAMTAYERNQAVPFPTYVLENLSGNLSRQRARLARLQREAVSGPTDRIIIARYAGECEDCGAPIERGEMIRYNRAQGARCAQCPTEGGTP